MSTSEINKSVPNAVHTSGGIRKSLLTPYRRIGLSKIKKTPNSQPFTSPLEYKDPSILNNLPSSSANIEATIINTSQILTIDPLKNDEISNNLKNFKDEEAKVSTNQLLNNRNKHVSRTKHDKRIVIETNSNKCIKNNEEQDDISKSNNKQESSVKYKRKNYIIDSDSEEDNFNAKCNDSSDKESITNFKISGNVRTKKTKINSSQDSDTTDVTATVLEVPQIYVNTNEFIETSTDTSQINGVGAIPQKTSIESNKDQNECVYKLSSDNINDRSHKLRRNKNRNRILDRIDQGNNTAILVDIPQNYIGVNHKCLGKLTGTFEPLALNTNQNEIIDRPSSSDIHNRSWNKQNNCILDSNDEENECSGFLKLSTPSRTYSKRQNIQNIQVSLQDKIILSDNSTKNDFIKKELVENQIIRLSQNSSTQSSEESDIKYYKESLTKDLIKLDQKQNSKFIRIDYNENEPEESTYNNSEGTINIIRAKQKSSKSVKRKLSLRRSTSHSSLMQSDECSPSNNEEQSNMDNFSNMDTEKIIDEIIHLEKTVQNKEMELQKVQQAQVYRNLHKLEDLKQDTDIWKIGCQEAIRDLLKKLNDHGNMDMDSLLVKLGVPSHLFRYDVNDDCFL